MMKNTILLSAIILFAGCGNSKKMKAQEKESVVKSNITGFVVGQGGGFTGLYEYYLVKKSGEVFLCDEAFKEISAFSTLENETTAALFNALAEINILASKENPPGNMNYSLVVLQEDSSFTLNWADSEKPKKNILTFYEYAFSEIRKSYQTK